MRANPMFALTGVALLLSATGCNRTLPASPTFPPAATPTPRAPSASSTPPVATRFPPTPAPTEPNFQLVGTPLAADQSHFLDGEDIQLTRIEMVSRTEGWGVAGGYILRTVDGGQAWHEVTPPMPSIDAATAEASGAFLDPQHAWVVFAEADASRDPRYGMMIPREAVIWNTADGGNTWSATEVIQEAFGDSMWAQFYALDPTRVWVEFRGVYLGAGTHHTASFLRTTDGGTTWESLPANVGYDDTGMAFADGDIGWLITATTHAWAPAPPSYAVTRNGGLFWDVQDLPPPEGAPTVFEEYNYSEPYQLNLLSARSVRLLMGSFQNEFAANPPAEFISYLYATEDGGANWNAYELPPEVLAPEYELVFFDADNGLLLGRNMYRTDDSGETWERVKTVFWDGQFSFVDPQHGWAVARSGDALALVKTVDGGRSWVELEPRAVR